MKTAIAIFALSLCFIAATAQPNPDTLWARTYEFDVVGHAWVTDVMSTQNGFTMFGSTSDGYNRLGFTMRITDDGSEVGFRGFAPIVTAVPIRTFPLDGGDHVIVGFNDTHGIDGAMDMFISRVNPLGESLWAISYERLYNWESLGNVCVDAEDHLVATGYWDSMDDDSNGYMLKLTLEGDTLWSRHFPYDLGSILPIIGGGYVVASDRLMRLTNLGDTVWTRQLPVEERVSWSDLAYAADSTIIAGGQRDFDIVVCKYNLDGDSLWGTTWGGVDDESLKRLVLTQDNGCAILGSTDSYGHGASDVLLLRLDSLGAPLWYRAYGLETDDAAKAFAVLEDGTFLVLGGWADVVWAVRTGPEELTTAKMNVPLPSEFSFKTYPNPFNPITVISFTLARQQWVDLQVFDLRGCTVATMAHGILPAGEHQMSFDGTALPSGIYFARLIAGDVHRTQKLVLLK